MSDPYQVLGLTPDASDNEVKTAYRELARKYHPDNYAGNPLSDLAEDKMQEINVAYDQIMVARKNGASGGGQGGTYNAGGQYYSGQSQFADIRRLISGRRITEAEELLDGVPRQSRDAEWHFLKGSVQYSRGWLDEAMKNFASAVQMDPTNQEYQAALNQMQWQRKTGRYKGGYRTSSAGSCSACDACATLYCADCCCECMGGDLIRCC